MSYTVEKMEKGLVKLSFTVLPKEFDSAVDSAYQKTKGKFQIAGFRKGHVPRKVIEGVYGKEVFFEDAMDIVIPKAYEEVLEKEKDLNIVARPELDSFDFTPDGGATFSLIVTVKPDVTLGEYKNLEVEKKKSDVSKEQIEAEIEIARSKQARLVDANRPAEDGDIVTIDFAGSVDGEAFEGGSAENYDLTLGSASFIPGFEEQLVGSKPEDEKDVKVKFPDDYHAENLKGKDAVFKCKIHSVKKKELPALDDEFVKEISEFDTLDEYKADIERKLNEDAEALAEHTYESQIVEKVVEGVTIEIPKAMIETEIDDLISDFEYRLSLQGLKLEDYLKYVNLSIDKMREEYKEQAERSVKTRLVMEEIINKEDIRISDEDLDEKIKSLAENAKKSVDEFKKTLKREQMDYLINQIISDKLICHLKELNPPKKA